MASDPDCLVVRRFDKLFTRAVLYQQARLTELSNNLDRVDALYEQDRPYEDEVHNGTVREDLPSRKKLVNEISHSLEEYCECHCNSSNLIESLFTSYYQ